MHDADITARIWILGVVTSFATRLGPRQLLAAAWDLLPSLLGVCRPLVGASRGPSERLAERCGAPKHEDARHLMKH